MGYGMGQLLGEEQGRERGGGEERVGWGGGSYWEEWRLEWRCRLWFGKGV